MTGLYIIH